ncbi:MAG: multidrug efflux MFS transporter [Chloroflexi bacterium]|nr:multidrug efflux MFS transporter [Chloroflexota bacterium]
MATTTPPPSASDGHPAMSDPALLRRITYGVAAGSAIASLAMNFWLPLLPLYMQHLGATSQANALFWTAMANLALGIGRIVSGPTWGAVSDRIGRKPMFVRTLLFASATIALVGAAKEPWQVAAAFALQGIFSGFTPAATALVSVSVPEERIEQQPEPRHRRAVPRHDHRPRAGRSARRPFRVPRADVRRRRPARRRRGACACPRTSRRRAAT